MQRQKADPKAKSPVRRACRAFSGGVLQSRVHEHPPQAQACSGCGRGGSELHQEQTQGWNCRECIVNRLFLYCLYLAFSDKPVA